MLIEIAKKVGVELTEDDFAMSNELSDDELDAVASGGKCTCVASGDEADGDDKKCVYVGYGEGDNIYFPMRCFCFAGGYSEDIN